METTTRFEERSDRNGLMDELENVAHGLRTAASALNEEHADMARYATRAANLVEGAGQKLRSSPRLVASIEHLRQRGTKAASPTASLLGFMGTRIMSTLGGNAASRAETLEPETMPRAQESDERVDVLTDELLADESPRAIDWQPAVEPWERSAEDAVTIEESPMAPMDDQPRSHASSDDEYASRY